MLLAFAILALQSAAPAADRCEATLKAFRTALGELREGDVAARERVLAGAELLAANCARPESRDVARYYAGLDDDALTRGMVIERKVLAARKRIDDAAALGIAADAWRRQRLEMIAELDVLAANGARERDWASGLRAASLAARLRVETLEADPDLPVEQRSALAAQAQRQAEDAVAGFERVGLLTPALEPRWLLGRLARTLGDRTKSQQIYERCFADAQHVGRSDYQEFALNGLIGLARDVGDLDGEERQLAALARLRPREHGWTLTSSWARYLLTQDHSRAALEYLERGAPAAGDPDATNEWHLLCGVAALRARDLETSRRHLVAAVAGRDDAAAALTLARLELVAENPEAALELVDSIPNVGELTPLAAAQVHALTGEVALRSGNAARARDELTQALVVARGWNAFLDRDPIDALDLRGTRNVIGEWLGVHGVALLAQALAQTGDPLEAARIVEEQQSRSLRRASGDLSPLRELAGFGSPELSRDDVRAWAASHGAGLVTWVIGPDSGVAIHVGANGVATAAHVEPGRAALTDLVRRFEEALVAGDTEWSATLGVELSRALFPEPIASTLARQADDLPLLLVAHGVLERLALERLPIDGRALEERFVISVLPGLVAARPRAAVPVTHWTFLGAPGSSNSLPSAREELEQLASRTPRAELAIDDACTRKALLDALAGGGGLHVATHARKSRSETPGRFTDIGLEVAGGEVVGANDIRERARALEFVVLSSCASAEGRFLDAEGLQGVARAFLEAGVRDVVATLRPVGDRAAREFALALHRRLDRGDARATAVRAARKELRDAGFPSADWTAFRLLGQD